MARYNDPYSGLSDGIQRGFSALAQSEMRRSDNAIRIAQIQNDQRNRDQDYQLRLKNFDLQAKQEERVQNEYEHAVAERGKKNFAGLYGGIQDEKGNVRRDLNPNEIEYFLTQTNDAFENDPWASDVIGKLVSTRSNGKYDRGRIVKAPNGFAIEMYDSKNPEKRGVMTDNGSTHPDDPVTQHPIDNIIDVAETLRFMQGHGTNPAQAAALLAESTGFSDAAKIINGANGTGEVASRLATVPDYSHLDREAYVNRNALPQRDEYAPAPTSAPVTAAAGPNVQSRTRQNPSGDNYDVPTPATEDGGKPAGLPFAQQLGKGTAYLRDLYAGDATETAKGIAGTWDNVAGGVKGFADEFAKGYNDGVNTPSETPQTAKSGPAKTDGPPDEFSGAWDKYRKTGGTIPVLDPKSKTPDGKAVDFKQYLETGLQYVDKAAKTSEADRRAIIAMGAANDRRQKAMSRYLLVETARGNLTPAQAIDIKENGIRSSNDMMRLAIAQPGSADVYMKWATSAASRVGIGKATEADVSKALEGRNKAINEMIKNVNGSKGSKENKFDAGLAGGVTDVMAVLGIYDPVEQEQWVQENMGNIQNAVTRFAERERGAAAEGRDMRSSFAYELAAEFRQGPYMPPAELSDPNDIATYKSQAQDLFGAFAGDRLQVVKGELALMVYQNRVLKNGTPQVQVKDIADMVNSHFSESKK